MSTTDTALWGQWKRRRDADAFAELVQRHSGMVFATCRRILGDANLAEDVTQECFLELLRSQGRVRTSLGALLHTIATRRSIDRVKGEVRRRNRERAFVKTHASSPTASRALELEEILAHVDAAISDLPEPIHAAIVGRFLEGQKHATLAESLGIAESTVRYRLEKGVEQIRESLKRRGIALSAVALTAALSKTADAAPPTLVVRLSKLGLSVSVPAGGIGSVLSAGLLLKTAVVTCAVVGVVVAWWVVNEDSKLTEESRGSSIAVSTVAPTNDSGAIAGDVSEATYSALPMSRPDAGGTLAVAAQAPEDASISGRVYDQSSGEGIAGVKLHASPAGGGVVEGWSEPTDTDGRYAIPKVRDGTYSVRISGSPDGYPDTRGTITRDVVLKDGQIAYGIDFALKRGLIVAGQVLDAAGQPVPNATVGAESPTVVNANKCKTDADGRFTLYMPEPTDGLMVQAQSEQAESRTLQGLTLTESGLDGVELVLDRPKTAVIAGVLVDAHGMPITRKRVYTYRKTPCVFEFGPSVNTDNDGRFRIAGLAADEYAVIVPSNSMGGLSTSEEYLRVKLQEGEVREGIEIVFGEYGGATIAGWVQDVSGRPVPDADVIYFGDRMVRCSTKEDGTFRLTGLPEGVVCALRVEHTEYTDTWMRLAAGTTDAAIVLKGLGSVTVKVTDVGTGQALKEFRMTSMRGSAGEFPRISMSFSKLVETPDGVFQKSGLEEGPFAVTIWKAGYAMAWQTAHIEAGKTAHLDFALQRARVYEGRVVDSQGRPVSDAYLFCTRPQHDLSTIPRIALAQSRADGTFVVDCLPEVAEYLCAYKGGYGIGSMRLRFDQEIVLPASGVLDGRIERGGAREADLNINVYSALGDWRYPSENLRPNTDGTFNLAGLTPGLWFVSVNTMGESPGLRTQREVEIVSGQTTQVVLELMQGTASVGGVITCEGKPLERVSVELERQGQADMRSQWIRLREGMGGKYRFENVCAGAFVLRATRYGEGPDPETYEDELFFDVAENANVVMNMDLQPLPE